MTNANEAISKINKIQDYGELQTLIETLLLDLDLDDNILEAIEKRQDELYAPTVKDLAQKSLMKGIKKQEKNIRNGSKRAIIKQSQINKDLQKIYDNA